MIAKHLFSLLENALRGEAFATQALREIFAAVDLGELDVEILLQSMDAILQRISSEVERNNPHAKHLSLLIRLFYDRYTLDEVEAELRNLVEAGAPEALLTILSLHNDDPQRMLEIVYSYSINSNNKAVQAVAFYHLGHFMLEGTEAVPKNLASATAHYLKAKELQYVPALIALGALFEEDNADEFGNKIVADANKARTYYVEAAEQNDSMGWFTVGRYWYQLAKNADEIGIAIAYLEKALNSHIAEAAFILGEIFSGDVYVPVDVMRAISYYQYAWDMGFAKGAYRLGLIFDFGLVQKANGISLKISVDHKQAHTYFLAAARANIHHANYRLGLHWKSGLGVTANLQKALEYFEKGRENGDVSSILALAEIYLKGYETVEPNCEYALFLFKQAQQLGANGFDIKINFLKSMVQINGLMQQIKNKCQELHNKGNPQHHDFDPSYVEVATSANTLKLILENAVKDFLKGNMTPTNFKWSCIEAVNDVENEFKQHRGWHGIHVLVRAIIGIVATLCVLPALYVGCCTKSGYLGTFFRTPETDSAKKLREFRENTIPLLDTLEIIPQPIC